MAHPSLASSVEIIHVGLHSDGDPSHRPKPGWLLIDPPTRYLELLGSLWMQARGETKPGKKYYLDRLPTGYALFERPRPSNPKIIDKHLYGHPHHKFFDSPNRFWHHFEHLMRTSSNRGCPCTICQGQGSTILPMGAKSVAARPVGRPKKKDSTPRLHVDEEGSPDPYRHLLNKLKKNGAVDERIVESASLDWRSERNLLPTLLDKIASQHSWMPRTGEIVLFLRNLDGEICYDVNTKQYKIFDGDLGETPGIPAWEAGVVGQVADDTLGLQDLCLEDTTRRNVNYSGFRVEPFPDPNQPKKTLSKQYKYVPLHQIRPFVFYLEYLKSIPEHEWHPTIKNAMTIASSVSLLEKYWFKGSWPAATIQCKGVFIGFELICIGDILRICARKNGTENHDLLRVNHIKLDITNLDKASDIDTDSGRPYNSTILISGKAFTLDKWRAYDQSPIQHNLENQMLPPGFSGYGEWYWLHQPSKSYQVSFPLVLGRCFEAASMAAWFPHAAAGALPMLATGFDGLQAARKFSSSHDQRIQDDKTWLWGDSRAESLDLQTLNGIELSMHDPERDPKKWRKMIKIMDGIAGAEEKAALHRMALSVRPLRPLSNFTYLNPATAGDSDQRDELGASSGSGSLGSQVRGKKRSHSKDGSESSDGKVIEYGDLKPEETVTEAGSSSSDTDMIEFVDEGNSVSAVESFRLAAGRGAEKKTRVEIWTP